MADLVLYSRPACHLCDEAARLIAETAPGLSFTTVDIEKDLGLLERYALTIPVVRDLRSGNELGWPFDGEALDRFLQRK